MDRSKPSILEDFGINTTSCGYCGREDRSSISHGMWAHSLSVEAYQELLDRGWRRSGRWLYKPEMATCCPQYTIRLDAQKFVPTKAQRRILRKMQKYLPDSNGQKAVAKQHAAASQTSSSPGKTSSSNQQQRQQKSKQPSPPRHAATASDDTEADVLVRAIDQAVDSCQSDGLLPTASFPASKAMRASPKQQRLLPADVRLISPSAKAIAGVARKVVPERSGHFRADTIAHMLADRLNNRMLPAGWCIEAVDGYLNCHLPVDQRDAAPQETPEARKLPAAAACSAGKQHVSQKPQQMNGAAGLDSRPPEPAGQQSATGNDDNAAAYGAVALATAAPSGSVTVANGGSNAANGAIRSGGEPLKVRIDKRRSFNDLDGASPESSMTMRSDRWQGVEGSSPMSISGMSPAISQRLLRNDSMAAVTSADASLCDGSRSAAFSMSPQSSLTSPLVWGVGFDGAELSLAPSDDANAAPQREFKRSRIHARDAELAMQSDWASQHPCATSAEAQLPHQVGHPTPAVSERGIDMPADRCSNDAPAEPDSLSATLPTLEVRMVPATLEVVDVEFDLYRSYQMQQHGDAPDEVTRRQFIRFLVDSPLHPRPAADRLGQGGPQPTYGSFHMQYWLGRHLIAVSVVDVLPKCLSSVYMFWDKRFAHLSLGKYSVLRELQFVREASQTCPQLHYLYLGFWIRNNDKMAYKADFQPSDLLCLHTLCWVPHARVQAAIDGVSYTNLSAVPHALEGLGTEHGLLADGTPDPARIKVDEEAVQNTMLLLGGGELSRQVVQLRQLLQSGLLGKDEAGALHRRIQGIHQVVGSEVGSTMILAAHLASVVSG